ncbi:hypothetical protein F8M41_011616 [Gigaspora margarita]|uniref:Uncharacterized protein n=1 Tax=Gigaspora margarita TaxID=4874 RepID=A0A8H4ATW1_GIGMA|nr:hypothetical protein F8M41_011616 [Gigaspora margarita]
MLVHICQNIKELNILEALANLKKVFQELKEIRAIKTSFGSGIPEDCKEAIQELISTQLELKEFQLNYSLIITIANLSKPLLCP